MSIQVEFVCWSSSFVESTIPTEAATPSREVLLATHTPLRIMRRAGFGPPGHGTSITEAEVFDEFIHGPANHGVRVATVIGKTGAGKSHLVRWVHARLVDLPFKADRHVIYLQKAETSLKDVIEQLLLGNTDRAFDDMRRNLSSLSSGMTHDELANRILNELAEALRTHQTANPIRQRLVGDKGLALFLLDPLFRSYLLEEGSFINRRARHALRGRDPNEPDVPLEFALDDLPLNIEDVHSVGLAAAATQQLFRLLVSNSKVQHEAVALMNELLDGAVKGAANLEAGDVFRAFMEIRKLLVGQEIILLIEDMALIQGVRRDLLDAIIEVGEVRNKATYATVRTMLAVTDGYYQESLPGTFKTRAEASSPLYEVNIDLDGPGVDDQHLVDFMGRYLNAARVGRASLEAESPDVPNLCTNCQYKPACHDAFGASSDGYGLYPYNKPAIVRAVRSCGKREQNGAALTFNPRMVLSRAVRNMLTNSIPEITGGTFPSPEFLAEEASQARMPSLPMDVRETIEDAYSKRDAGRLAAFVSFWGDGATKAPPPDAFKAFSLPELTEELFGERTQTTVTTGTSERGGTDVRAPMPPSLQRELEAIENWSNGLALPQSLARELRAMIRSAILARVVWLEPTIKEPDATTIKRAFPVDANGIFIEDAGHLEAADPILRILRTAKNAVMFRGLILLRAARPELAGEALPRLDAVAETAVPEAKARIIKVLEIDDVSMVDAAALLLRGAAVCGHWPSKRASDIDYVNAALWLPPSAGLRKDRSGRQREWLDAYDAYMPVREDTVRRFMAGVGAAQGIGAVHAIDIQRLLPIVSKARGRVTSDVHPIPPSWGRDAQRRMKAIERYADAQVAHWQGLVNRVRRYLPAGVSYREMMTELTGLVTDAAPVGLVKVADLPGLNARHEKAKDWNLDEVGNLEKVLTGIGEASELERLVLIGTDAGGGVAEVADFLNATASWVDAGLREVETSRGTTHDLDNALARVSQRWLALVGVSPEEVSHE